MHFLQHVWPEKIRAGSFIGTDSGLTRKYMVEGDTRQWPFGKMASCQKQQKREQTMRATDDWNGKTAYTKDGSCKRAISGIDQLLSDDETKWMWSETRRNRDKRVYKDTERIGNMHKKKQRQWEKKQIQEETEIRANKENRKHRQEEK